MGELDWRERPNLSPFSGFFIQSRYGRNGNFEVVIPWHRGGLAHFARDNDRGFQWHGPANFGDASIQYIGATVIESDFKFIAGYRFGNLEVLATRTDGTVDHYWRENGGNFVWHGPFKLFEGAGGAPSLVYTGAEKYSGTELHGDSLFFVVYPFKDTGFANWMRWNVPNRIFWENLGSMGSTKLVGTAFAITTIGGYAALSGLYKEIKGGRHIVAGVDISGGLRLYVDQIGYTRREWVDQTVFGRDIFLELDGEFHGRPCLIQGDYGHFEVDFFSDLIGNYPHLGNLELMVPSKNGGLLHFWRDSGYVAHDPKPISEGWVGPIRIPGPIYDEVSIIQSNFSTTEHGNLEMVARKYDQPGFDFFWRDEKFQWHGPQRVGPPRVTT